MMSFAESIKTCLSKYATFSGRATRAEYWWFYLFTTLVTMAAMFLDIMEDTGEVFLRIAQLAFLLPSMAAGVRRMHDINHSGWWILCPIYNIILMCYASDPGANDYGEPEA